MATDISASEGSHSREDHTPPNYLHKDPENRHENHRATQPTLRPPRTDVKVIRRANITADKNVNDDTDYEYYYYYYYDYIYPDEMNGDNMVEVLPKPSYLGSTKESEAKSKGKKLVVKKSPRKKRRKGSDKPVALPLQAPKLLGNIGTKNLKDKMS